MPSQKESAAKPKSPIARFWDICKNEHHRLRLAIFLAVAGIVFGLLPYYSTAQIIALLIATDAHIIRYAQWAALAFCGFAAKEILYNLAIGISHKAAFYTLAEIRRRIVQKLPKLPLGTILDTSSGRIKQIFVDQVDSMETTLAHLFPELTSNIAGPVLLLILMCLIDWRLALASLATMPIGFMVMGGAMKGYGQNYAGSVKVTKEMNDAIVEYIGGIEVIKSFGQSENSYGKYKSCVNANASYFYNWMKSCQFPMALAKSIIPANLIVILPLGWFFYLNGSLSVQHFIMAIIFSFGTIEPLMKCMNFVDTIAKNGTIINSIEEILNEEEQNHAAQNADIKSHKIELKDVRFAYHGKNEILHGINLTIPEGKKTALVGPSGSGKSTIAKLIGGFWDVQEGSIRLGGIDEKEIPLEQLYSNIAYVAQENFLFNDTIRENIRLGNLRATDKEVEEVAKLSGCHDFIMRLEKAYDTNAGQAGTHLSGGEKQRIAIARAMLKNAPVIILDEATAYIDPENEAIIQKAIAQLTKDKTVIIIAHRLSTIKDADQIVVVNKGSIESAGTHEDLLEHSGLYKNMWLAHTGNEAGENRW